jgi:hypothetical protein
MSLTLCELLTGSRMDVCTFDNGATGAFFEFLDGIGADREAMLLSVLERIGRNGTIENTEIYGPIRGHIGLFKLSIADAELACFKVDRKLVICKHANGKMSPLLIDEAHLTYTKFLVDGENPKPKGSTL